MHFDTMDTFKISFSIFDCLMAGGIQWLFEIHGQLLHAYFKQNLHLNYSFYLQQVVFILMFY